MFFSSEKFSQFFFEKLRKIKENQGKSRKIKKNQRKIKENQGKLRKIKENQGKFNFFLSFFKNIFS